MKSRLAPASMSELALRCSAVAEPQQPRALVQAIELAKLLAQALGSA